MDSVLKSSKPRCVLTGNRNGFAPAQLVSPKLHEFLGYKSANISNNSDFDISDIIEIQNWIDLMVLSTCKLYLYQEIDCTSWHFSIFRLVLKWVWRDIRDSRNGGHCLLTVRGWLHGVKIRAICVKYFWLSCPAWPSRRVLCISKQWLRLKSCHVTCDECVSGEICSLQHMWVTRVCDVGSRELQVTKIWGPRCERD